jgi:multiple sugar transport system permease protein
MTSQAKVWVTSLQRRRSLSIRRREAVIGYLYLTPWLLGFILFTLGPMIASLVLSFTDFDLATDPSFLGLRNYRFAFVEDRLFWHSLSRTLYFSLIVVPLGMAGSLLAAMLLDQKLVASNVFRTFFFLPHLTPIVAAAILWRWILQPQIGPINYILSRVGIVGPAWLASPAWAVPALAIIALWRSTGGNRMMIFLAALQGVPQELYEAADIDGASFWHKFWHVTLPMLSPTLFLNMVLAIIAAFKVFASAFVATQGGPVYATWFYALHLYHNAFELFHMGYASALAWIFFIVLLVLTLIQFKSAGRWVYYAGEVR